ncbi:MAG: tyrosine-protein phosphatase, partial [Victivallales bacterium]|nr:tyrosine-protein phosphatase [Victivallales bacterium]
MKIKCFLIALAGLSLAVLADTISLTAPENGVTVSMLKPEQQLFCHLDSEAGRKVLANPELVHFLEHSVRSFPKGIELSWIFTGVRSQVRYEVALADNEAFANARTFPVENEQRFILYNLFNGKTYYWKVTVLYANGSRLESELRNFTVDSQTPRVLYVPDVDNVRDIGGFVGLEDRVVPQGLIYRSSGLNNNSYDGGKTPGPPRANAEGVRRMREELHLRTELDLRSNGETAGMTVSPIGADINYIQIPVGAYDHIFTPNGAKPFAECFRIFLNPANYPIDYHCIGGADRTGSLSFLLEALLGADTEAIHRDYVLTSFYARRGYEYSDELFANLSHYGTPEESWVTKAERYFFAVGITPDEIETFRAFILGPGLAETPGCALQRKILALAAPYTQETEDIKVRPYYPFGATMKMAGKDIPLNAPLWKNTPVQHVLADGQGGTLIQLLNHDAEPRFIQLRPNTLDAESYTVVDLLSKTAYAQKDGTAAWTPAQLRNFAFTLPVGVNFLLAVVPGTAIPEGYTLQILDKPSAPEPNYLVVPSGTAPKIDGVLDDEIWTLKEPLKCFTMYGMVDDAAPLVYLRTDVEHNTLFVAADIPDTTPNGTDHGSERDLPLWNEDEIEVFVGGYGRVHFFHFI